MNLALAEKLNYVKGLDYSTDLSKLIIILVCILLTSFFIDFFLSRSIFGKGYRFFVAPGIIVHELSHALMCLLTGAKISKIALFDKEGGKVEHSAPKIPILGQIVISLAPMVFGAAAIYLLSRRLGITGVDISSIHLTKDGLINFLSSTFANLNFHSVNTLIIVYLVLSIAVTLTPSLQDLRNITLSLVAIGVGIFLIYRFTAFRFDFNSLIPNQLIILLSTVTLLLILGLFLSIILYITSKLISR